MNDLGRLAQPMLTVEREITWQERLSGLLATEKGRTHPDLAKYEQVLRQAPRHQSSESEEPEGENGLRITSVPSALRH